MRTLLLEGTLLLSALAGMFFWLGWLSRRGAGSRRKGVDIAVREIEGLRDDVAELRDAVLRGMKRSAELTGAFMDEWREFRTRPNVQPKNTSDEMTDSSLHRQIREVLQENEHLVHALRDKEENFLRLEEQLHQRLREADEQLSAEHHAVGELERRIDELRNKLDPRLLGPDDLGAIKGVGPKVKKMLHEEFEIHTFRELAALSKAELDKIGERLRFPERPLREDWVGQAIDLHYRKYSERLENSLSPKALPSVA